MSAVFAGLSVIAIASAVMVLRSTKLTYAALWLAGLLVSVAALFLTLGAQFLAVVQILIYAGAVVTLILFAIMLAPRGGELSMKNGAKLALAVLLLVLLAGSMFMSTSWRALPTGLESFSDITETLFGPYFLAFEILSVLLLAALIGAVWMARKEKP